MNTDEEAYKLILELTKLKTVFRNTTTLPNRSESTAEHSWSASMIVVVLMKHLLSEFKHIDEYKTVKLTLIHDIVEIYAGDVTAFDQEARKHKEQLEQDSLTQLMSIYPEFGNDLYQLWYEFEEKQTIESKIAKAADAICPIFQRLQTKQSYIPFNITIEKLEATKLPHLTFSQTFTTLFEKLKKDLIKNKLI